MKLILQYLICVSPEVPAGHPCSLCIPGMKPLNLANHRVPRGAEGPEHRRGARNDINGSRRLLRSFVARNDINGLRRLLRPSRARNDINGLRRLLRSFVARNDINGLRRLLRSFVARNDINGSRRLLRSFVARNDINGLRRLLRPSRTRNDRIPNTISSEWTGDGSTVLR
jgi:hypothetical protein